MSEAGNNLRSFGVFAGSLLVTLTAEFFLEWRATCTPLRPPGSSPPSLPVNCGNDPIGCSGLSGAPLECKNIFGRHPLVDANASVAVAAVVVAIVCGALATYFDRRKQRRSFAALVDQERRRVR
jgi:hypothetical protein